MVRSYLFLKSKREDGINEEGTKGTGYIGGKSEGTDTSDP